MATRVQVTALDLAGVEARTQEIGRELFAAARREHAQLSVLNRWTAQVLAWCLSDSAVKANILRFIDVLPSLSHPREIARHVQEYFPTQDTWLPPALRLGAQLARPGLVTHGALAAMVRQLVEQVARQFIAGTHTDAVPAMVQQLAARGATCSLDLLGEQVLTEAEAEGYGAQCEILLREAASAYAALPTMPPVTCGPRANLSVKPSALSPRFDPISPRESIARALTTLQPIIRMADAWAGLVTLDMEHEELRELTLALAQELLVSRSIGERAQLGVVIQAYLRDAEATTESLLAWLAAHERTVTVRLVKGAYWDFEIARAQQLARPSPVHPHKAETDAAFERLTRRLLSAFPLVTTAIASHNVRSIAHAMAVADALGLRHDQLEFQLLYGMGDALHAAIVARGYPVRIYAPIGELIPGMAYLVRRVLENTANESFLRQDFTHERDVEALLHAPAAMRVVEPTPAPVTGWRREPLRTFAHEPERHAFGRALQAVRQQLGRAYPALIGDEEVTGTHPLVVSNPAHPSKIVGHVARVGLSEMERAVRLANAAQPAWAAQPVAERAACLRRAAGLMREAREELTAWTVVEVGKTWREADVEIVEAIEYLEYYANGMEQLTGNPGLLQLPGERNAIRFVPRGVAVVIAPWNFPAAILTGMTAASLVTGHAVLLKPSEQSSVIAAHVARLLRQAGVPPGALQLLPGSGEEIGAALVRHPQTHTVLFTGSRAVGLSIIEACAQVRPGQRFIKHVVAEMGGKNAILVDADADLDAAVLGTVQSAFGYAGQKCSAASRVIVHAAVFDRFLSRLAAATDRLVLGDPADPATDVGPLIEAGAQRRLEEAIAHARRVATVAYQYPTARRPAEGFFVGPTIVTEVPHDDRLAREELFGPLLCAFRVSSFDEALALANDTDYALTGGVYSRSPAHLERAARAFDVGNLYLNRPITGAMVGRQPFGGHRLSGLGTKAGGPEYLRQLLIPKTICVNTARHGMPLD